MVCLLTSRVSFFSMSSLQVVLEMSSIAFVAALITSYKNWTCALRTFVTVNDIATWEVACSYRKKAYSESFPWFPNMQFGMDFPVT